MTHGSTGVSEPQACWKIVGTTLESRSDETQVPRHSGHPPPSAPATSGPGSRRSRTRRDLDRARRDAGPAHVAHVNRQPLMDSRTVLGADGQRSFTTTNPNRPLL